MAENDFLKVFGASSQELELYIKQIKSYEEQVKIIEKTAKVEEELKKNRPVWELVLWTGIAGIRFHVDMDTQEGRDIRNSLQPGVELKLVREPENQFDRWAIAVYTQKDEKIGFVTRYKNEAIARLMDYGHKFHAIVEDSMQSNYNAPEQQRAYTENYDVSFSIWMEK